MNQFRPTTRSQKGSAVSAGRFQRVHISSVMSLLLVLSLVHCGCFSAADPSHYYGRVIVPKVQLLRWSDGGLPQTFDPAFAAAAPDTDAVRALFEGLTDYDPVTLVAVPAVAIRWESSPDNRLWTFYLREDALWSNGERVTASDFVRSWKRTIAIGALAPHTELLNNIEGATGYRAPLKSNGDSQPRPRAIAPPHRFGLEAIGDHILRVRLQQADANFPALVSHPVFRPVKFPDADPTRRLEANGLISNGAFQLARTEADRVLLERAKTYWDGASVALQKVEFVNSPSAEDALAAYRAGEIDAVTNAPFEPLALKLLAPYRDFRRLTFGALTYYSFNTSRTPFDDVRVREALAISIDRDRVSGNDLGGATEPAGKFLPEEISGEKAVVGKGDLLDHDVNKARALLAEAGYPDGEGFPTVRLLVNRNEQQRVVAQSISAMWLSALNIETEIIIKNWDDYEAAIAAGEYDVVRRGIVMQTTDELTNLRLLFQSDAQVSSAANDSSEVGKTRESGTRETALAKEKLAGPAVESESQALKELKAIPIYFASSYALVKPYVSGFESNVLDAPSLKRTRINPAWVETQP
jgi:oligopeptide transport system substrate-binding protein